MSKAAWNKPVKCDRAGNCGICRRCKVRVNSENYRKRRNAA